MTAGTHVVVGVSESPGNESTVAWALRESSATGAQLVLVRAAMARSDQLGAVPGRGSTPLEPVDATLAKAVASARTHLGNDRVAFVVDRDAAGEVLVRSASFGDLIVIGPPARAGWWSRVSTTYHVVTHAFCPVVIVHTMNRPDRGAPASTSHPPSDIGDFFGSHVVVGIDGSPSARAALGFGFAFAAAHDLPVVAATVTRHTEHEVWFDDRLLETHLATDPELAVNLAREIEPWHLKHPGVPVKRALVGGVPLEGLRRVSHAAAMLVVGTAGSGHTPLGSVSHGLIERASCPVAVVRD